MAEILRIENISKKFHDVNACDDISFDVKTGEFLAVVGESGSGKSTLAKIISNLEKPLTGEVYYKDLCLTKLKPKELRLNRKKLQFVSQDTGQSLNPKMKVKDIICEPLLNFKLISKKQINETAIMHLKSVGLDESFLNKKSHEMSGGQRQRVNIARALTLKPEILLLDEPTSALDVISQSKILVLLKKLQKEYNLTILFICHDIALVTNISDRIVVMKNAKLIEIINTNKIHIEKLDEYTKELLQATFDLKKCSCKFPDACTHI